MPFQPESVGKCIFWAVRLLLSSVCSSGQILLPGYLMNGLSNLD